MKSLREAAGHRCVLPHYHSNGQGRECLAVQQEDRLAAAGAQGERLNTYAPTVKRLLTELGKFCSFERQVVHQALLS